MNRPVPELPIAEDHDVLEVQNGRHNGGDHHAQALTAMITNQQDAPACPNCGHVTVRNGACYKCLNCGESLGCS